MHPVVQSVGFQGACVDRNPVFAGSSHRRDLFGCQDGEANPRVDERRQGFVVGGGFGQPNALGVAAEASAEIGQAPGDLGAQILG